MKNQLLQVTEFHRHIGAPVEKHPKMLEGNNELVCKLALGLRELISTTGPLMDKENDPLISRALMSIEELAEWLEAHADGDLNEVADAWADRCYLLFGDCIAEGLPALELFNAVHESNMTKSGKDTVSGKGVKSETFKVPKISIKKSS